MSTTPFDWAAFQEASDPANHIAFDPVPAPARSHA